MNLLYFFKNKYNHLITLVTVVGILCIAGSFNVFSAGMVTSYNNYNSPYHFMTSHLFLLFLSTVLAVLIYRFGNYKYLNNRNVIYLLIAFSLAMLIYVKFAGVLVNGSRRWINLFIFSFQPSEFAKLSGLIVAAYSINYIRRRSIDTWQKVKMNLGHFIWVGGYLFALFILVETQPDLGTSVIIILIPFFQFWIGTKLRWKQIAMVLTPLALLVAMYLMMDPAKNAYRLQRIQYWWDPWISAQKEGYQSVQSMIAIGSGQLTGMGYGHGLSKYAYLPESHTDFAIAILAQEWGFIGVIVICILFLLLQRLLCHVAYQTKSYFGKMLVVGVILLIIGEAIINMLMVAGLLPVVGVPLPFISYGGSSLLINMAAIGLVANIIKENHKDELREQKKQQKVAAQQKTTARPVSPVTPVAPVSPVSSYSRNVYPFKK